MAQLGLPDLGDEVSVRRVIVRGGARPKAYVNGALVNVGVLARMMKGLVDLAGQHEHMGLFDPTVHRALVDRLGGLEQERDRYREAWSELERIEKELEALGGDEHQVRQRVEFLRFQLDEIDRLDPAPGEDGKLEEERRRLLGSERLLRAASAAEALISGQDGSALELVGRALTLTSEAQKVDRGLEAITATLQSARVELEEGARALSGYLGSLHADPGRLAEVDDRLDAVRRLCRKHAAPLEALLQKRAALAAEIEGLENRQGLLDRLGASRAAALACATERSEALSAARIAASGGFSNLVKEGLRQLAMGQAEFAVEVRPASRLGADGGDEVEFLFSANPGEPVRPLSKVASGGEASRLLLALKRAFSQVDDCHCYVLDEADAGVGGAVAEVVGRMIRSVAQSGRADPVARQVLCITHLPQVAAFADAHLVIEKDQRKGRTHSRVISLPEGELRTRELARMLSGVEVSSEALGAAKALVRSARASIGPARTSPRASAASAGRLLHARRAASTPRSGRNGLASTGHPRDTLP